MFLYLSCLLSPVDGTLADEYCKSPVTGTAPRPRPRSCPRPPRPRPSRRESRSPRSPTARAGTRSDSSQRPRKNHWR